MTQDRQLIAALWLIIALQHGANLMGGLESGTGVPIFTVIALGASVVGLLMAVFAKKKAKKT